MLSGNRRRFSCDIPLSHIFGFCRGVRKVIFGSNHTVVLQRKADDNDAIWREDGAAIKDMTKTGAIFPLLAAIPALISAAALTVAKAAALGAVGTAAGMALKKATGKGLVHKEGQKKTNTNAKANKTFNKNNYASAQSFKTISGSIRSGSKTTRTPPSWYPR